LEREKYLTKLVFAKKELEDVADKRKLLDKAIEKK